MPMLALAFVVLADLVPDRWVLENLYEATASEGLDAESYDRGYAGGLTDGFSECKRITIGLGDPPGQSTIESAILSPTLGPCDVAIPKIQDWAQGEGAVTRAYSYARYWNGSAVVFRPLIATVGVAGTRVIAALAVASATLLYWLAARRRLGGLVAGLMVSTMVLTTDFLDLAGALLHALSWTVALLAAALIILLPRDCASSVVAWWMFVLGGAFLFLADLTNPELAWTLAVASVSLTALGTRPVGVLAGRIVVAGLAWIAGFMWLWVAKWIVYAMVVGVDWVWDDVVGQVETRLDGQIAGATPTAWEALERVFGAWWDVPLTSIVLPLLLVATVVLIRRYPAREVSVIERVFAGLPAVIPIVWYTALRNHTYLHFWFVYRSLAIAFSVVIGAALVGRSTELRRAGDVSGSERASRPDG